jgi:acyl-CoA thioesterase FadM
MQSLSWRCGKRNWRVAGEERSLREHAEILRGSDVKSGKGRVKRGGEILRTVRRDAMARVKLELPENSMIHEARVRFLEEYGYSEINIEGTGIIMVDSVIVYKSEGFYGDILECAVTISDCRKSGCDFVYRLTNRDTGKEIARAKTGIVFFDYEKRRVVEMPEKFKGVFCSDV